MGKRQVKYIVVCEDKQQATFVQRFLKRTGLATKHNLRIEKSPAGRGAADQFVCNTYVKELRALRKAHVGSVLLVMIDGDKLGVNGRMRQLDAACRAQSVETRSSGDPVAITVPTWNIETWLAYLNGEEVSEDRKDYPKFPRRESRCQAEVEKLVEMCSSNHLREPAPASLRAACDEYHTTMR